MKPMLLAVLFGSALCARTSHAAYSAELEKYFEQKITAVNQTVAPANPPPAATDFVLTQFTLGISASVSVGIPAIMDLTISPSLSFGFATNP